MSGSSHALYSILDSDLSRAISPESLNRIRGGDLEWPGMSYLERSASSLRSSLLKKIETGMTDETRKKALEKFLQVNEACGNWTLRLDERYGDDQLLGEFKQLLWKFWTLSNGIPLTDSYLDVLERGQLGPGAAIGSPGGDFYTKLFSSRLSLTDRSLYFWYRRYIRGFPEWNNAEETRVVSHGNPMLVEGNRLDFVPKNDDISRSICVEPVLNMFFQLGFGSILSSRLKHLWGINLTVQQFKNRELARKGSWDGSFSTIDLSSASDSISIKMLEYCLPPDFLRWLCKFRSRQSRLPNGSPVGLNMVSTMGNGFTFPLQTVLFTAVVLAAFRCDGLAPVLPFGVREGNFGVNGDDIVVPTRITAKVLRLLRLLGFTPNGDKTFIEGPFRESCGGDYFNGRNLRGVFVKRLGRPEDSHAVVNQLNLFSMKTGIFLPRLVQYFLKKAKFLPVPVWENDDAGIKVPFSMALRYVRENRDTQSLLYFAWTPEPPPRIRILEGSLHVPDSFKLRDFNLSGLWVSFLQGSVNSGSDCPGFINLKPKAVRYRRKPRITCNWDSLEVRPQVLLPANEDALTIRLFAGRFDWSRWETAVYMNLYG